METQPDIMQRVAPIFGKDLCCFIQRGGYIRLPPLGDIGSTLHDGFYLGIDVQPEGQGPSILLGTGISAKTLLTITYNEGGVTGRVRLDLCDDRGRKLIACTQLSKYAAKRLIISVDVGQNDVQFYEFNILPSQYVRPTEYISRESPRSFSNFSHDMLLGGACIDGERVGHVTAKVGNFFIGKKPLPMQAARGLLEASKHDLHRFYGSEACIIDESSERRALFRDDLKKIHLWATKEYLSAGETRDCAAVLFRWLFDSHPMLQDLRNEL